MKKLIILLLCLPFIGKSQAYIAGTATYGMNANTAKIPDAGAKVFILAYREDAISMYETIHNFLTVKKYRILNEDVDRLIGIYKDSAALIKGKRAYAKEYAAFQDKIAGIKAAAAERNEKLQAMKAETNALFEAIDLQTAKTLSFAKLKAADLRSIADASGNYAVKVSPGTYAVLIISENRTGLTSAEVGGKLSITLADVHEGESVKVNAHFFSDQFLN